MTSAAWCTSARSAIGKQSWKMHDEYFQIAFCSFTNAHWNAPASFRDFGRITFVIQRDDQTGLALWRRHGDIQANASASRTVPLARLDVVDRDSRVGSLDCHSLQHRHYVTSQLGWISVFRKIAFPLCALESTQLFHPSTGIDRGLAEARHKLPTRKAALRPYVLAR